MNEKILHILIGVFGIGMIEAMEVLYITLQIIIPTWAGVLLALKIISQAAIAFQTIRTLFNKTNTKNNP